MSKATIVLADHPHTRLLRSHPTIAGVAVDYPIIDPVHDAFDDMLQRQPYEICEMAIVAFLQAYDAGIGVRLLPFVQSGGQQHRNIFPSARSGVAGPADLKGRRIGVKSFSQTTGLWVRGWLADEFGIRPDDAAWYVTERSHVAGFTDPDYVHLLDTSLKEALAEGTIDAAIMGRSSAPAELEPLAADFAERDRAWAEEHHTIPINHMVLAKESAAEENPDFVRETYRLLVDGLAQAQASAEGAGGYRPAVRSGLDQVVPAIELAARYAFDQGLISRPIDKLESLFVFNGDL